MRKQDRDRNKRYFRSSDRFIRLNGDWYFSTREGDHGPYPDEMTARRFLKQHIHSQEDLKVFQEKREAARAKREARMQPRQVNHDGLFALDTLID